MYRGVRVSLVLLSFVVAAGCGKSRHHGSVASGPRTFALTGPTNLSAFTGLSGQLHLAVTVNGLPSNGDTVTIVPSPGITVSPPSVVTNGGEAVTTITLASTPGTSTLTVTMVGADGSGTVTFRAVDPANAGLSLVKVSGDAQSTPSGGNLAQPLVVRLTDPQNNGAPFVGSGVTFTSPSNPTPGTDTTDSEGIAGILIQGITSPPGTYAITAQAVNGAMAVSNPVTFTFTVQ